MWIDDFTEEERLAMEDYYLKLYYNDRFYFCADCESYHKKKTNDKSEYIWAATCDD